MKLNKKLWLSFSILFFTLAGEVQEPIEKAEKILNSAREAIYKGIKQANVKGFLVKKNITGVGNSIPVAFEKIVQIEFPSKIKVIGTTGLPNYRESPRRKTAN